MGGEVGKAYSGELNGVGDLSHFCVCGLIHVSLDMEFSGGINGVSWRGENMCRKLASNEANMFRRDEKHGTWREIEQRLRQTSERRAARM